MASLPNKISKKPQEPEQKPDSFNRWLGYSALFHTILMLTILSFNKFNIEIWKKPPPAASVVWTQTVKKPKPTIPDKLPPPMVPIQKVEEAKKDEINIKKTPVPEKKTPEESAKDKMKKALEALKKNIKEDDRPAPREDNFPTQEKQPEGILSDQQILALQASSIYSAYESTVKQTVTSNFIWYKTGTLSATISMKIDPQGNIINPKIVKSSGDFAFDQATLRAVEKSNPLPAPSEELVKMFLQENFEFKFERKE